MGLMTGNGPLGRQPAGHFNFEPPPPGQAVYLEPTQKRVRVEIAGETVADSRAAFILQESGHQPIYYFPPDDVRSDLLEPGDRHTRCPKKGEASYYSVRVGDQVVENVAWYYPDPIEGAAPLRDLIAFYWNRVDRWLEEDEEVFVHPRDPYHRVDVVTSKSHIRVSLNGELLAETDRAMALFESNLPPRWYMPREDVVAELEPTDTVTRCPYKGTAGYYSVKLSDGGAPRPEGGAPRPDGGAPRPDGVVGKDFVWYYDDPLPESTRIGGLVCFFNERVDIEIDGELQERPASAWSHGVKSEAQNAPPAQTRG